MFLYKEQCDRTVIGIDGFISDAISDAITEASHFFLF